MDKKPYHLTVAERLIEQLEAGTAPWQRPWKSGQNNTMLPVNPVTGKRYRGINAVYLMSSEYTDQRWLTYKQAQSVDAQVRKGEKGTFVQYWKFTEEQIKTDEKGRPVLDENGKQQKEQVRLERPKVFLATVFNAEQVDGLPPPVQVVKEEHQWNVIERAEAILTISGANIIHRHQDNAYYQPNTDRIILPNKEQFETANRYYATALHELGHWTGHESRLARDLKHPFGSEAYAREELRAEIASMMLGDELGIGHDPSQHASYVQSWVKALKKDSLEIFRAASDAENIQDYVLAFEQKRTQEVQQPQRISNESESIAKVESNVDRKTVDSLTPAQRAIVVSRIRQNIAISAERGNLPARQKSQDTEQKPAIRNKERELER